MIVFAGAGDADLQHLGQDGCRRRHDSETVDFNPPYCIDAVVLYSHWENLPALHKRMLLQTGLSPVSRENLMIIRDLN